MSWEEYEGQREPHMGTTFMTIMMVLIIAAIVMFCVVAYKMAGF